MRISRILVSYATTIFEMRKFTEVKPGKWQGNNCHDDQTMTVCQLGGYMASDDFRIWIENIMDNEPDPDDDDYADVA